jgi:hypothetical protein
MAGMLAFQKARRFINEAGKCLVMQAIVAPNPLSRTDGFIGKVHPDRGQSDQKMDQLGKAASLSVTPLACGAC